LKHTGSDLLPGAWPLEVSAELELVEGAGAGLAVEEAGAEAGVCGAAGACWARAAGKAAIKAAATAKATTAVFTGNERTATESIRGRFNRAELWNPG
jgi:hypothetical protein